MIGTREAAISAVPTAKGSQPSEPTRLRMAGPTAKPIDRTVAYTPMTRPRLAAGASALIQNSEMTKVVLRLSESRKRSTNQTMIDSKT